MPPRGTCGRGRLVERLREPCVRCRRVRVQCGTDCGVRRRLLGFFISTIVLGLLTKGFKISVQKVAFMTVQGIKVEVPEWGMLLQVEEIIARRRVMLN